MLPQWKWIKIPFLLLNFCILIKEIFPLFLHAWSSSLLNFNTERNLRDYQVQSLHFRCEEIRSQKTELVPNGTANYSQRQSKSKENPDLLTSFSVTVAWIYLFYPTYLFCHCVYRRKQAQMGIWKSMPVWHQHLHAEWNSYTEIFIMNKSSVKWQGQDLRKTTACKPRNWSQLHDRFARARRRCNISCPGTL